MLCLTALLIDYFQTQGSYFASADFTRSRGVFCGAVYTFGDTAGTRAQPQDKWPNAMPSPFARSFSCTICMGRGSFHTRFCVNASRLSSSNSRTASTTREPSHIGLNGPPKWRGEAEPHETCLTLASGRSQVGILSRVSNTLVHVLSDFRRLCACHSGILLAENLTDLSVFSRSARASDSILGSADISSASGPATPRIYCRIVDRRIDSGIALGPRRDSDKRCT